MKMFQRDKFEDKNLTVITVTGHPSTDDIKAEQVDFHKNPTLKVLWDFTNANFERIDSAGAEQIVLNAKMLGKARAGGKTAIVVKDLYSYAISRVMEAHHNLGGLGFTFSLFKDLEDAMRWIVTD